MSQFNRSKIIISVILIVLIAGLGVINFTDVSIPYLSWVEKGMYNFISPFIEYPTMFCNSIKEYWNGLLNVNGIIKENKELKKKVSELEFEKQFMYRLRNENYRLRELLAFKKLIPSYETLGARVIGYSASQWDNKIIINRGSNDGIKDRMPVISYNGILVGRVDYVGANSSQILLINDSEFIVGGIVQRTQSRAIGLVKGQIDNSEINMMDNISWNKDSEEGDIRSGDIIVTSGLSNSYPKGLPIGKVITVEQDNYGLSQKAEIDLFINLKTIEEVLVITDF